MSPYHGAVPLSTAVGKSGLNLLTVGAAADSALGKESPPVSSRSSGDIGNQLDIIAELIEYGLPTKAYGVGWGSFDTHSDQLHEQRGVAVTARRRRTGLHERIPDSCGG